MMTRKRILIYTLILILTTALFVACKGGSEPEYISISAKEGKDMLAADPGIILIDVRTKQEFDAGYIEGSINIPDFELASKIGEIVKDKNTTVILYCRSGNRSRQAALKMIDMGYTKVYDMGGLLDWPYETTILGDN